MIRHNHFRKLETEPKTMTRNEIKKYLYKEKPSAFFDHIINGKAYYHAILSNASTITFEIPVSDMQETRFHYKEDSQLLIRWMIAND